MDLYLDKLQLEKRLTVQHLWQHCLQEPRFGGHHNTQGQMNAHTRCGLDKERKDTAHQTQWRHVSGGKLQGPEILLLSELMLTEEERDHMVSLVRGISKVTQSNSVSRQTQTHRLGRPNQHSCRPNSQVGWNQDASIAIYTLIGVNINHFLDLV